MTGDLAAIKEFLSHTPFFGGLDDRTLERVIAGMQERSFPAGATVFREGDTGNSMYIVRSGTLVICQQSAEGHAVRLLLMRPGDFVGVTTLIEMEPRPFSAIVERDAVLYELTGADLYRLYKEDTKSYVLLLQNINRELCRRLRKAGNRIALLTRAHGGDLLDPSHDFHG